MFTALALLISVTSPAEDVKMTFIPSGAVQRVGGYSPIRAEMSADASGVKKAPEGLTAAKYGKLAFGDKSFAFILDEPASGAARLFVDTNNDGDLTNDPATTWAKRENNMYFGSAQVDLGKGQPVGVSLYRFDPNDAARAALKNTILYYGDFGYELSLSLDGKPFTTFIAGEPKAGTSLSIDRNGDKKISYFKEIIAVGKPFNFTGTTYVLNLNGGKFTLDKADKKLPVAALPPDLSLGKKSLTFTATTTDGQKVNFPKDYKGKLVMIDFWATWCGPCIGELPNVKAAYSKFHDQGFEILGISFDQANMAEKLKDFTEKNGMPWRQVYEGKYWNTTIGEQFDVSAIPFTLLVDGDTGEIVATGNQMRGPGLSDLIEKQLAKKKGIR